MAVKGSATVTISQYRDTESVTRYYKLQSSSMAAPDKPSNVKPNETPAGWSKSEPACDITKTLYTCDVTMFSDKTTHVSDVSKSTSYEAAKEAWNKANNAQGTANEAAKTADNYISTDSTGIMVSENKGATKETPSNATKNNVLITEKDVQIRNGKKVVASYGDSIRLGEAASQHISVDNAGLAIQDGDKKQFEVRTLTKNQTYTDVWLNVDTMDPETGPDTSKVFSAAEIDSALDSTYYDEEILNLTFPIRGVPKVTLIFDGGNSEHNVPTDPSSPIHFTAADQAIAGEALKLVIDYRDNPSGIYIFNWMNLSAIKVEYSIYFTPTTVRIGDGATKDTFINDGTSVNSFKALKVGKGMNREGNWQNDNAFDVDFDGNTHVGRNLEVDGEAEIKGLGLMVHGTIDCVGEFFLRGPFTLRNAAGSFVPLLDLIYPVGSIYMSVNAADPGTLIGGTWERIKDRFLLSAGDKYAAGNTGGSAKATLPSHTHTVGSGGYQLWGAKSGAGSTEPGNQISGDAKYYAAAKGNSAANYKWLNSVDSKGVSDVSQANMPPYLAVYVWKRIS